MIGREQARAGTADEVDWIRTATAMGTSIEAAVPLVFEAYATVVVPDDAARVDEVLIELLAAATDPQPWWLGHLDSGASDVVRPDLPPVTLYTGWSYVLLEGGPDEALGWRRGADKLPWHGELPELIFPVDRSWLVTTLWDDDWRCLGGPVTLIESIVAHPDLDSRSVRPGEEATPPGHSAL